MKTVVLLSITGLMLSLLPLFAVEESGTWWEKAAKEAKEDGYTVIKMSQVKTLLNSTREVLLLDVRPHYEYAMGHIPNAVNMEFHLGDRMKLEPERKATYKKLLGPDKHKKVLIYCRSYT